MLSNFIVLPFLVTIWFWPFIHSALFSEFNVLYTVPFFLSGAFCILLSKNKKTVLKNPSFPFVCLFFAAVLLSAVFSKDHSRSIPEFYKHSLGLLAFFTVLSLEPGIKKIIPGLLTAGALAVSVFALYWVLFVIPHAVFLLELNNFTHTSTFEYLARGRFFIPFLTPSALASYVILILPLAAAGCSSKGPGRPGFPAAISPERISGLLTIVFSGIVLSATQSLGALLALFIALLVFLAVQKKKQKAGFFVSLLIVFLLFGLIFCLRESFGNKLNSPVYSVTQRLIYWKQTMPYILSRPLIGNGLNTFPSAIMQCAPHNSFIQIWAETGILGLLSFVLVCWKVVSYGPGRADYRGNRIYNGLWTGNLAFLIHNLLDSNFFAVQVSVLWWVIAAMLLDPDFGQRNYEG